MKKKKYLVIVVILIVAIGVGLCYMDDYRRVKGFIETADAVNQYVKPGKMIRRNFRRMCISTGLLKIDALKMAMDKAREMGYKPEDMRVIHHDEKYIEISHDPLDPRDASTGGPSGIIVDKGSGEVFIRHSMNR